MGLKITGIGNLLMILLLAFPLKSNAVWQEPVEVVKGAWGNGDAEFFLHEGQYLDVLPYHFAVMPDGRIVFDAIGGGKVYSAEGNLLKNAAFVAAMGAHTIDEDTILVFAIEGEPLAQRVVLYNVETESIEWIDQENETWLDDPSDDYEVYVSDDRSKFVVRRGEASGIEYSSSGGVLGNITNRPFFFGKAINRKRESNGQYTQMVTYEDAKFPCSTPTPFGKFRRDNAGHLYGISRTNQGGGAHTRVYKITRCGKIIGQVDLPVNKVSSLPDYSAQIDEGYGDPVFASNGDVYTWKRTPTHYSILKWAWVDDPNVNEGPDMPEEVQALPSNSGIYLTWNPSPQDPGCVSGYEIERASTAAGPYSSVGTVPLNEDQSYNYNDTTAGAGQTWYYRIRSASDIGNSDPAEVSAARP